MRASIRAVSLVGAVVCLAGCSVFDDKQVAVPPVSAPQTATPSPLSLPPVGLPPSGGPAQAVVLGDSLTFEATEELREFQPNAMIDAWPGRTVAKPLLGDAGLARVDELLALGDVPWVIALGTNDAGYGNYPVDQLIADVTQLLNAVGPGPCIAWVIPVVAPPMTPTAIERSREFGDVIRFALAGRPCSSVIDWPEMVATRPALLESDGVHLAPDGERLFAQLIDEAIDSMVS